MCEKLSEANFISFPQASYLGTDEDKFVQVFTQRSFAHLKVVFEEYKKVNSNGTALITTVYSILIDKCRLYFNMTKLLLFHAASYLFFKVVSSSKQA